MKNKTCFIDSFLVAFTLMLICSGLSAGTLDLDGKKRDKEKKEKLSADGPYVIYEPDGKARIVSVDVKGLPYRRISLCMWLTIKDGSRLMSSCILSSVPGGSTDSRIKSL